MRQRLDIHFAPGQTVGLLGGSFNPAHAAHLEISLTALRLLRLDKIVWMVSPQNPLKPKAGMAPLDARMQSARDCAAGHKDIIISRLEEQIGTEYTVDTVSALRRRFRGVRFIFLLGSDNLLQLPHWRQWARLFQLVPIAVFARPGSALSAPFGQAATAFGLARLPLQRAGALAGTKAPAWVYIPHTSLDISSTRIRAEGRWPS